MEEHYVPEEILEKILSESQWIEAPISQVFTRLQRKNYHGGLIVNGSEGILSLFDNLDNFLYPNISAIEINLENTFDISDSLRYLLLIMNEGIPEIEIVLSVTSVQPDFRHKLILELYDALSLDSELSIYLYSDLIFLSDPFYDSSMLSKSEISSWEINLTKRKLKERKTKTVKYGTSNILWWGNENIDGLYGFDIGAHLPRNIANLYYSNVPFLFFLYADTEQYSGIKYVEIPIHKFRYYSFFPNAEIVLYIDVSEDDEFQIMDAYETMDSFLDSSSYSLIENIKQKYISPILDGVDFAKDRGIEIKDPDNLLEMIQNFEDRFWNTPKPQEDSY